MKGFKTRARDFRAELLTSFHLKKVVMTTIERVKKHYNRHLKPGKPTVL